MKTKVHKCHPTTCLMAERTRWSPWGERECSGDGHRGGHARWAVMTQSWTCVREGGKASLRQRGSRGWSHSAPGLVPGAESVPPRLVRNAHSRAPPQTYWMDLTESGPSNPCLSKLPGWLSWCTSQRKRSSRGRGGVYQWLYPFSVSAKDLMVIPKRSKDCLLSGAEENFSEITEGTLSIAEMAEKSMCWCS